MTTGSKRSGRSRSLSIVPLAITILAPRIVDEAVKTGANRAEGVRLLLQDEAQAEKQALQEASDAAHENARVMAAALEVALVRIHSVQQEGVAVVPPPIILRGAAFEAATPTPVLPGQVSINAQVTLTYQIH